MPRLMLPGFFWLARFSANLREKSLRVAAVVMHSLKPQLLKLMPWPVTSPASWAFFMRNSSGSMPIASASMSMCCSMAKVACRLP